MTIFTWKPICILASATVLSGCLSSGLQNGGGSSSASYPNNGENTRGGAALGAAIGGVFGALTSDSDDRVGGAVKGAIIGGAAGAIGGSLLDRQEEALRQDLNNQDVTIENTGSELIVTMPQDILFAVDSAELAPSMVSDLSIVARNLLQYPASKVDVRGHTDNSGSAIYNQDLSRMRADAVAQILYRNGVPYDRVNAIGYGEDRPVASNLTEAGKAQNRRVEIVIVPTG